MDKCDVISRLPGDILISILSRLTLKEAMVTSVLSPHWEKMWTFYDGNLEFEVSKELQHKGCSNYARLVNKVMVRLEQVESGGVLDSFTIRCNMCPDNLRSVDRWVHFALEKRRVKRLILENNIYFNPSGCLHFSLSYDFPLQRFNSQQSNIRALTSIHFRRVNVSGEIIEQFLSNCPLLQKLDLIQSFKKLIHLRVSGKTLALRHLLISHCVDLTNVEVSAPNLISLTYQSYGRTKVKFDVQNVQKLVKFSIGDLSAPHVTALGLHLLTCFSSIQMLELEIHSKEPGDLTKLTKLTSVKHLTLKFDGGACASILAWPPLLKAFPLLQKFTVNMGFRFEKETEGMVDCFEKIPNKYLKEFEFIGFGKSSYDVELVMCLLKNIATIEKVLLFCNGGTCPGSTFMLEGFVRQALGFAKKLKKLLPKKVKLVISTPSCPVGR